MSREGGNGDVPDEEEPPRRLLKSPRASVPWAEVVVEVDDGVDAAPEAELVPELESDPEEPDNPEPPPNKSPKLEPEPEPELELGKRPRSSGWVGAVRAVLARAMRVREYFILMSGWV